MLVADFENHLNVTQDHFFRLRKITETSQYPIICQVGAPEQVFHRREESDLKYITRSETVCIEYTV